ARHIFENVNFSRGNISNGDVTCVCCVARFLCCVKRNPGSVRRDRGKNAVRDLFLTRAVEIGYPDRLVAFKRDMPIGAKNWTGRYCKRKEEKDRSFHGKASVAKNVMARANTRTIRYTNPPKKNLKILRNQPCR